MEKTLLMPYNDYKFKKGNKSMKNIYLKYTLLSVAISSSLLFTACGHKHTFADATCTTPKTCTECNEIEGDALGHTWLDATCENPMTCSVCNLTDGDVLEHSWLEATTEAPKTCELCALTDGEPLPEFQEGEYTEADNQEIIDMPVDDQIKQGMIDHYKELYESGVIDEWIYNAQIERLNKADALMGSTGTTTMAEIDRANTQSSPATVQIPPEILEGTIARTQEEMQAGFGSANIGKGSLDDYRDPDLAKYRSN